MYWQYQYITQKCIALQYWQYKYCITLKPCGFPMLCCPCSSKKEDNIQPNGDDAKLRQSRREEMSKFWEHEHLLQINADANFNFPPTEAVLLLRQTQHWKPMRTPRKTDRNRFSFLRLRRRRRRPRQRRREGEATFFDCINGERGGRRRRKVRVEKIVS